MYERAIKRDGLTVAAPTQIAVDLLTGSGRMPSEGDEMIAWMKPTSVSGVPDPLYVRARRTRARRARRTGTPPGTRSCWSGPKAVYLHTADTERAVAEYTTDADLAIAPGDLAPQQVLELGFE